MRSRQNKSPAEAGPVAALVGLLLATPVAGSKCVHESLLHRSLRPVTRQLCAERQALPIRALISRRLNGAPAPVRTGTNHSSPLKRPPATHQATSPAPSADPETVTLQRPVEELWMYPAVRRNPGL